MEPMIKMNVDNFRIEQIADSGQCFRMNSIENGRYSVIAFGEYLELWHEEGQVCFSCSQEEYEQLWHSYFDMDTDYGRMRKQIDPSDEYLICAAEYGSGIRILRQELWEVIVTFLISQQNNMKRIRKCTETLCQQYGEGKTNFKGNVFYSFPTAEALAEVSEEELRACNLGYRAKYIKRTAQAVVDGNFSLSPLFDLEYEEAKKELIKLYGVGVKVADCICLFGLHHVDAFPIDTHILKVLECYYPNGFPLERYQGFAGILQQYAFYYDVNHGLNAKGTGSSTIR